MVCITGYTTDDAVGDKALEKPPQKRLKLIDGSISSYFAVYQIAVTLVG